MSLSFKTTIGANGRVLLPTKIREKLNLFQGDQVSIVLDDELKIIPLKDTIRKIQTSIKARNPQNISLVDSLIENRRQELQNE